MVSGSVPSKPVVNKVESIKTDEQISAEVRERVDRWIREKYGADSNLLIDFERAILILQETQTEQRMNANRVAQAGVEIRTAPNFAAMNYMTVPHRELRDSVNEQADPAMVGTIGQTWDEIGDELIDSQQHFSRAIAASESEWSGDSGNAARQFMAEVGNYIGKIGVSAQLAGTQAAEHSAALQTVRTTMPEVIEFDWDKAKAELAQITDPVAFVTKFDEHMATYQASVRAHEQAAFVADGFDTAMAGASAMPAFPQPPMLGAGGTPPRPPGGGGGRDGAGLQPGFSGDGPGAPGGGMPGGGSVPGGSVPPDQPGKTVPGHGSPIPIGGGQLLPGGPGYVPPRGGDQLPGGGHPVAGGPVSGFAGGRGAGGSMGRGFSSGGSARGGAGLVGGPKAGVGGPGAEHVAAGGRGTTSGSNGRSGPGGMGGMGAGRGRGADDEDHERANFLMEADPDELFGTDEKTAPPVIGG